MKKEKKKKRKLGDDGWKSLETRRREEEISRFFRLRDTARLHRGSSTGADRWSKSRGLANNRDEPGYLDKRREQRGEIRPVEALSGGEREERFRERETDSRWIDRNLTEEWHVDRRKTAGDDFAFEWTETRRKWLREGEESSLQRRGKGESG